MSIPIFQFTPPICIYLFNLAHQFRDGFIPVISIWFYACKMKYCLNEFLYVYLRYGDVNG